ncbi:serine/threonine-protein kinase DCLK1-like [Octopus vulgaris]|uniref:Serine/threonine-protein kinase DCLK1-like n=1 Tax=Octopus vulgaris TaxID=6645 RepID=A0AA36HHF1_OCTVU|nr:serine/threonine-protein kinase DCLK1-like [Octopus vulgaris]
MECLWMESLLFWIKADLSPSNNQEELFDKILSGHFEFISPFWDEVSSSAKDLIEHMIQVDPEMRFSAAEVLDHPWVANDTAKDNKLHVAKELNQYFTRTKKPKDGLAVIASTALDKGSKYFRGRGASLLCTRNRTKSFKLHQCSFHIYFY